VLSITVHQVDSAMRRRKYICVSKRPAVLTLRFFCPGERCSKILVTAKLKDVIFHNRVILILTVSGLLLFNRLKDSGNYTYHTTSLNPLTPYDPYSGRRAPLTSKRCVLYIYSTNIGTEYFKHGIYCPFFSLFKMQFVS